MQPCANCGRLIHPRSKSGRCRACTPYTNPRGTVAKAYTSGDWDALTQFLSDGSTINDSGCWVWTLTKTGGKGDRYPARYSTGTGEQRGAHRIACDVHYRMMIPRTMQAHHTCANSMCVNPDHLRMATAAENMAEMQARRSYERRIAQLEAALAAVDPTNPALSKI